jgi:hypothetical protein
MRLHFLLTFRKIILPLSSILPSDILRTYSITELSRSWEAANCAATQELTSNFMEPDGLLPCSQEPSTGPYPEPDRSSPYHHILSKIYFNIFHPPTSLFFLVVSSHLAFPPISYMHSSSPPFVLHARLISSSLAWYFNYIWWRVQVMKLLIMQFSQI